MTLHPITVVENVIEEYRRYLRTEFRARNDDLRAALEHELTSERFLAQEPFFHAQRPFKAGKAWRDLRLNERLAPAIDARALSKSSLLERSTTIDHLLGSGPELRMAQTIQVEADHEVRIDLEDGAAR